MKRLYFVFLFISCSVLFHSCNITDSHPSRYPSPYDLSTDIYFRDVTKNIFVKIAHGYRPKLIPNSNRIVYLEGVYSDYRSGISMHTINKDGTDDKVLISSSSPLAMNDAIYSITPTGYISTTMSNPKDHSNSGSYLIKTDGGEIIMLPIYPSTYSHDGKRILSKSSQGIIIFEMDTKNVKIIKPVSDSVYISNILFSPDEQFVDYLETSKKTQIQNIHRISLNNPSDDKILYTSKLPTTKDPSYSSFVTMLPNNKILVSEKNITTYFVLTDIQTGEIKRTEYFYNNVGIADIWIYYSAAQQTTMMKFRFDYANDNKYYNLNTSTMIIELFVSPYPADPISGLQMEDFSLDFNQLLYSSFH